ncbi:hypothetical protein DIZ27_19685 [Streptomyces sp. NWU339]|nr:hypothetical protein DIZ27_19685 [Streptomyces sp. NWU339]
MFVPLSLVYGVSWRRRRRARR